MPSSDRTENIFLRCTKIVIYLIPILPLFIAPSVMFPYITGKNFAFRILVEAASVFWIGLMATKPEYRVSSSAMILSLLIFTFITGLADLFGINPYNSFWSNYERMEGYITVLHLVLFFLITKSIFKTSRDWIIFFSIFLVVSVLVSLFTFVEPLSVIQAENYIEEYGSRRAGTIGNPSFLSSYLLLSVFVGLILTIITKRTYLKFFYILSIVLNTIVIYITASRGAILAIIIGAVMLGISLSLKRSGDYNKKSLNKVVLILIIGLLLSSSAIFLASHNSVLIKDLIKDDKTLHRFAAMFNSDPSIENRLYAWRLAWNGFKENPVLGWGQENFFGVYTVNPITKEGKLVWMDRAHNIILDWLVNAGILGLFAYLSIYGIAFYILRNNLRKKIISRNETFIIATAIIVYFIQNLFTFDSISSYIIFFALIAYIDCLESIKTDPNKDLKEGLISKKNRTKSVMVIFSALIVFSLSCYYLNYIPFKQLRLYTQISISLPKYNSFTSMLNDFNRALSYGSFGDNNIREEMSSVSKQIIQYQLYREEGALELIYTAAEEMEKGLAAEQYNLEYILKVYGFYELLAAYDPAFIPKAEALIEKSLLINPEYSTIDMYKINLFFLKKDYESAYQKLKESINQHPNNVGTYFKLALAAILTSRADEMEKTLENYKRLWIANNEDTSTKNKPIFTIDQLNKLAQAYMEVKNYRYALKYYNEIFSNLSNYRDVWLFKKDIRPLNDEDKMHMKASLHMEIAKVYRLLGDRENAEKEAKKAAETDPEGLSSPAMEFIELLKK
jgi:oligosaccharide repeat unit polymerase